MDTALTPVQIANIAERYTIPYDVLYGLIGVESGNDPAYLSRWEPAVGRELNVASDSPDRWLATSIGPGHVMGYRLREMGYTGDLWELTTPDGIERATEYAAVWLLGEYERSRRDGKPGDIWQWAINRYNAGTYAWQGEHMDRFDRWRSRADEPGTILPMVLAGACFAIGALNA